MSHFNKFSDLNKIIQAIRATNGKIAISRVIAKENSNDPFHSFFIEGHYKLPEKTLNKDWPIFLKKNLNGVDYIIQGNLDANKSLIATFIPTVNEHPSYTKTFTSLDIIRELGINDPKSFLSSLRISYHTIITSDIFTVSGVVNSDEIINSKAICKYSIRCGTYMFLIFASFNADCEDFDKNEISFYSRLNSSVENCRKTCINIVKAAEITGIDKKNFIGIAEFIIKNMIVINPEEFFIDCNKPKMNFSKFASKIQAFVRGFKARKT